LKNSWKQVVGAFNDEGGRKGKRKNLTVIIRRNIGKNVKL